MKLLVISGHDVLGEILRRNAKRQDRDWFSEADLQTATHVARLGDSELVESNLPLPDSRHSPHVTRHLPL